MKCETPARSSRSSREPAPIQKPSATERTLGTFSEITRSPESSSERTYFCTGRSYRRNCCAAPPVRVTCYGAAEHTPPALPEAPPEAQDTEPAQHPKRLWQPGPRSRLPQVTKTARGRGTLRRAEPRQAAKAIPAPLRFAR